MVRFVVELDKKSIEAYLNIGSIFMLLASNKTCSSLGSGKLPVKGTYCFVAALLIVHITSVIKKRVPGDFSLSLLVTNVHVNQHQKHLRTWSTGTGCKFPSSMVIGIQNLPTPYKLHGISVLYCISTSAKAKVYQECCIDLLRHADRRLVSRDLSSEQRMWMTPQYMAHQDYLTPT
eukprot:g39478.t1